MNNARDISWRRGIILFAGVAAYTTVFRGINPNDIAFWRVALCTFIAVVSIMIWDYEAVRNEPIRVLAYLLATVLFAFLAWLSLVLGHGDW
jgi:hypothetical protein